MAATVEEGHPVKVEAVLTPETIKAIQNIKEIVATFNSYPLLAGQLPVQLMPHAPNRHCAKLIIAGNGQFVVGKSQSDCQNALEASGEFTGNVTYIDASKITAPIEIYATSEMWAALITAGANPTIVGVIKEMRESR